MSQCDNRIPGRKEPIALIGKARRTTNNSNLMTKIFSLRAKAQNTCTSHVHSGTAFHAQIGFLRQIRLIYDNSWKGLKTLYFYRENKTYLIIRLKYSLSLTLTPYWLYFKEILAFGIKQLNFNTFLKFNLDPPLWLQCDCNKL